MITQPDFARYLPPSPPLGGDTFRAMVECRLARERERGYAVWAVETKRGAVFVGQCGLYSAGQTGPRSSRIPLPQAMGEGYATEAAQAVLAYAFGTIGLHRVIAFVMSANVASSRVAEKAGMRFEDYVTAYDIDGLKKFADEKATWRPR